MSKMAERIKRFYDNELWSKEQVHDACRLEAITKEEYEIITGEPYIA